MNENPFETNLSGGILLPNASLTNTHLLPLPNPHSNTPIPSYLPPPPSPPPQTENCRLELLQSGLDSSSELQTPDIGIEIEIEFNSQTFGVSQEYKPIHRNEKPVYEGIDDDSLVSGVMQIAPSISGLLPVLSSELYTDKSITEMPSMSVLLSGSLLLSGSIKEQLFEPTPLKTCAICSQSIETDMIFIGGQFFHVSCVSCNICGCFFNEKECFKCCGHHVCNECLLTIKQCRCCGDPIISRNESILIDGSFYHTGCFRCYECNKLIENTEYQFSNGIIYCNDCSIYIKNRNCDSCGNTIFGRCIKKCNKYFHTEHFVCDICRRILKGNNYLVHHNKFYCMKHGQFLVNCCHYCKSPISFNDQKVHWKQRVYHPNCFVCRICGIHLETKTCKSIHGRPHCLECFNIRVENGESSLNGKSIGHSKHHTSDSFKHGFEVRLKRHVFIPQHIPDTFIRFEPPPSLISNNHLDIEPDIDEITKH